MCNPIVEYHLNYYHPFGGDGGGNDTISMQALKFLYFFFAWDKKILLF